jgi:hypothetical protein
VSCWAVHVVVTPVTALLTPPYGDTHFRKISIILSISAKHSKPHCDESLSGLDHWTGLSREDHFDFRLQLVLTKNMESPGLTALVVMDITSLSVRALKICQGNPCARAVAVSKDEIVIARITGTTGSSHMRSGPTSELIGRADFVQPSMRKRPALSYAIDEHFTAKLSRSFPSTSLPTQAIP